MLIKILSPIGVIISRSKDYIDRLRLKKLMEKGLKIGNNVYINKGVKFDYVYPFLIEIEDNCRISNDVRILAHDATTFRDLGITRIAPVKILEGSFIGENVTILPGVTIGPRALIAAGSVVNRDIGEDKTAAGNPARPYGKFSDLLNKYVEIAQAGTVFSKRDIEENKVTPEKINSVVCEKGVAFIQGTPTEDKFYVNAEFSKMRDNANKVYFEKIVNAKNSKI